MITLDTSGLLALIRRKDAHHADAFQAIKQAKHPLVVPAGILSEITYMLEQRTSIQDLQTFLLDIEEGHYHLDCGERDFPRIRQLIDRYQDLPIGFADASVIACAERRGGLVLTYDVRHFPVVAREDTIQIVSQG